MLRGQLESVQKGPRNLPLMFGQNHASNSWDMANMDTLHYLSGRVGGCVFIPSPVKVGTLLSEVPGTPIGASFFEFELKPTGNDSADQTQHEFQHHIV